MYLGRKERDYYLPLWETIEGYGILTALYVCDSIMSLVIPNGENLPLGNSPLLNSIHVAALFYYIRKGRKVCILAQYRLRGLGENEEKTTLLKCIDETTMYCILSQQLVMFDKTVYIF